jgi:LCP family protein required for cell wall assembly
VSVQRPPRRPGSGTRLDGPPQRSPQARPIPSARGQRSGPPSARVQRQTRAQRRRRRLIRTLSIAAALILIVGGGSFVYSSITGMIHRITVGGLSGSSAGYGAAGGVQNILLVGSTDRCALTTQNPAYGLCSQGVNGINSDIVMILHLVPATHTVTLLSIPRDTFVPNARAEGANKIDAGLVEGPTQLVAAIQDDFGIPIQHYVSVNFDTFANVVNALGGVRMYFPMPVYDAYSGLLVLKAGCHYLNGTRALEVVRARHLQYQGPGVTTSNFRYWTYENESDLARIRRTHEFLRVLASEVAHHGLGNPITDYNLARAVAPNLKVDQSLSLSQLANLATTFHAINMQAVAEYTLPVSVTTFGGYDYKGGAYGDVVFPDASLDREVIAKFLGTPSSIDTMTGKPLPSPSSVHVSVVDGASDSTQTQAVISVLMHAGFQASDGGTQTPWSPQATETVVAYAHTSQRAAAEAVAAHLGGFTVLAYAPQDMTQGADVTVITGTAALSGVGTPTMTSDRTDHPAGQATLLTAVTSGSTPPGFMPPAPSNEPLQPWDPRSCTASGGEGP